MADAETALPERTIGVVMDSPSPHFDKITESFSALLEPLSQDQYSLKLKYFKSPSLSHGAISQTLQAALKDQSVDALFTAGLSSTHLAMRLSAEQRSKPVIGGAIEFSDLSQSLISPDGTSRLSNFSFVMLPQRISSDLQTLASLSESKIIHALVESNVIVSFGEELAKDVAILEEKLGTEIRIVSYEKGGSALNNLPPSAKAVYIPLLPSITQTERKKIFQTLARKRVIHVSMLGKGDVDDGAFAALAPDLQETLPKRLALNFHQVLQGINTKHLPVILQQADQLNINLATAQKIQWSPDYDTSLTANFFEQEEIVESNGVLHLEQAMKMATEKNLDISIAKAQWESSYADALTARAAFGTTASLVGESGYQRVNSPISLFTPKESSSLSLGVEVNRLLYSNQLYRQIQALDEIVESSELNKESVTLDSVESTGHAFLDALLAEEIYKIQKRSVMLAQENLNLAKIRFEVGARDNTDALRWEASLASARSQLMQADSDRKNARLQLNVLLDVDPKTHWDLTEIMLTDEDAYFIDNRLFDLIENKGDFQKFIHFCQELSVLRSPELKSFLHTLKAQGILLKERSTRYRNPQVQLSASATQVFQDSSLTRSGDQNEWVVGVGFSVPFLEWDLRKAEMSQIQAGVKELQAQEKQATYLIQQRAMSSCYNMAASHPGMRLSRKARIAAEKNFKAVQDQYSVGQANIVQLIDAQSSMLNQEQAEMAAQYGYLKDIVSLQRSLAWYEFNASASSKEALISHFLDYLKTGSIHVRVKQN